MDVDRYKDREKRLAYIKAWKLQNREKTRSHFLKWYIEHYTEYYQKNKHRIRRASNIWRAANEPEKQKARMMLKYAVRSGQIKRGACAVCKARKNIHGHHFDYSKPLEVIWLCLNHHLAVHGKQRRR